VTDGPSLVIMAAGVGRRYGGLKQTDPLGPGGSAIPEYTAFDAARAGFGRIVLVVRPEIEEEIRTRVGERIARRLPVVYVHQPMDLPPGRAKPWGTGQAVLATEPAVRGPFGVANADDLYGRAAFEDLAAFLGAPGHDWALVGYPLCETLASEGGVSRGVCRISPAGVLERIEEVHGIPPTTTERTPVSMNLWGFRPDFFEVLRDGFRVFRASSGNSPEAEFLLPTIVQEAIGSGRGRVRVLPARSRWCGVTHLSDRPRVQRLLADAVAAGEYPEQLWT
jgi:NDP-sugar pyrophosphorylase family protein